MKYLILITLAFISPTVFSQELPRIAGDTLYTKSGFNVVEGTELIIGVGSQDDGDFKFIRQNQAGFAVIMTQTTNNAYNKNQQAFRRNNAGRKFKIVKLVSRGDKKHGYIHYALINLNSLRYEVDIDNAIRVGELEVPDEYKTKPKVQVVEVINKTSVADELIKLKGLLDQGVITQEEYDAQKKKLLNN